MSEPSPGSVLPQAIDPFAPSRKGRYDDYLVSVIRTAPPAACAAEPCALVRTDHFRLTERDRRVEVSHWLRPDELDNDVAGLLADELFAPGWLSGPDTFERVFTGVVRSCVDDPLLAWCTFYGNTLARMRQCWRAPAMANTRGRTTIGDFAPVYAHALQLIPAGQVLDVGSCFGFLPLLLAERPTNTVTASDLSGGAMCLLAAVAAARGLRVVTLVCDAARIPLPDGWADTVSVIHLLEHLTPEHSSAVLREALRVAGRQVVVAVPIEPVPTATYGHVRDFSLRQLEGLGDSTGHRYTVHEHHGGWLVLGVLGKSSRYAMDRLWWLAAHLHRAGLDARVIQIPAAVLAVARHRPLAQAPGPCSLSRFWMPLPGRSRGPQRPALATGFA